MSYFGGLLDDRWVRVAAIAFVVMLVISLANLLLDIPDKLPLLGLLTLPLVPILFVVEAVIFIVAILRS